MAANNHTSGDQSQHDQLRIACIFLLLASTLLLLAMLFLLVVPGIHGERERLGIFVARQLADSLAEPLARKDLLSINVILTEATDGDNLAGVAAYDLDNNLLAEIGRLDRAESRFAAEVAYQETVIGHVSISFAPSMALARSYQFAAALLLTNLLSALLLLGKNAPLPLLLRWRSSAAQERSGREVLALMKHRLRAINLPPATVRQAVALYDGTLVAFNRDEILVSFAGTGTGQTMNAVSCCVLLINMQRFASSSGELRAAICLSSRDARDLREAHHMANLCPPNKLVVSSRAAELLHISGQVNLNRMNHTMAPEDGLLEVSAIREDQQGLIEKQAKQLLENA